MKQKQYYSIDDQISHLKSKNLSFHDEKSAKKNLLEIGYYKLINAYKIPFTIKTNNNKTYKENVYFEDIYNLYYFDRKLKTIVFEAATSVEITFKSYISNVISENYGIEESSYLKKENFSPDTGELNEYTFGQMKKYVDDEIKKQYDNMHPSIKWYKEKYNFFPFWVVVNILTLGTVSRIYSKLKGQDKITVAKNYSLPFNYLEQYIRHINLVRNICAHNDVLYRYKSNNAIPQTIKCVKDIYTKLNIRINSKSGRYCKGSNDLLSTIIILKLLLNKTDYNLFKTKLVGLLKEIKKSMSKQNYDIIFNEMGLIEDWYKI